VEDRIYKIVSRAEWAAAEKKRRYDGSAVDQADGFIHFSTAAQMRETAARHFGGQADLMLVEIDAQALGDALKWEPSRGGALFPHLYGPLEFTAVTRVSALPLGPDGTHLFPKESGA
jgi:uncharacterized protein (DUF952 family)